MAKNPNRASQFYPVPNGKFTDFSPAVLFAGHTLKTTNPMGCVVLSSKVQLFPATRPTRERQARRSSQSHTQCEEERSTYQTFYFSDSAADPHELMEGSTACPK
jgi:hypothetical protein